MTFAKTLRFVALGATLSVAGAANALVEYLGVDAATDASSPAWNSRFIASHFDTHASSVNSINTITWEQYQSGAQGPFSPFAGVTVTQSNVIGTSGISSTNTSDLGYNTTLFYGNGNVGRNHLRTEGAFNNVDTEVVFNFANPINAFGMFITGFESNYAGDIFVEYNSSVGARSVQIPKPASVGGVAATGFFGFVDDANFQIFSVKVVSRGDRSNGSDFFGIDDVRFTNCQVVPEPGTIAALGLGALVLLRRRKK